MNNDPSPKTRFTGIFIPKEIIDLDLTPNEMFLLSYIDALHCDDHDGCFASNAYLAKTLKLKENTIAIMIGKLKEMKLVELVSFNGRQRVIRAAKEIWFKKNTSESKSAFDSNQSLPLTEIKVCPLPESNPLNIYSKEESKEDTLSTLSLEKQPELSKSHECVSFFLKIIQEKDPAFKLSKAEHLKWAKDLQAMHEIDGRSWDDIFELIVFAQNHEWWPSRSNTTKKLRKNATSIHLQMKSRPIKANEEIELKNKQTLVDKNHKEALVLLRQIPAKYHTSLADEIRIHFPGSSFSISYDDPDCLNKLYQTIRNIKEK